MRYSPDDLLPEDNSSVPEEEEDKPETPLCLKLVGENSGEKPPHRLDVQSKRRCRRPTGGLLPVKS